MSRKLVYLTDTSIPTERLMEEDCQQILKRIEQAYDVDITYVRDQEGWTRQQFVEYASDMEKRGADAMDQCEKLIEAAADAEMILANFAPVGTKVIEAAPDLRFVGITRSGAENVAVDAATEHGVKVCVAPGRLADPVADYTVGMMLAESRNISRSAMGKGVRGWDSDRPSNFASVRSMRNKVIGIVGYGMIGQCVAKRVQAFGAKVIAYDPFTPVEVFEATDVRKVEMDELMASADFVSVHARLTKDTEGLVTREHIARMKPTAFFVNTARAGLVDEDALTDALVNHRIAGAALDVFRTEPLPEDHPLMGCDNVTLTPHRAGGTSDLAALSVDIIAQDLERYLTGETLLHTKN